MKEVGWVVKSRVEVFVPRDWVGRFGPPVVEASSISSL